MAHRSLLFALLLPACSAEPSASRTASATSSDRIADCDEDTAPIDLSASTTVDWEFKGATWPGLNGDEVHDDVWGNNHIDESFAIMDELGMNSLRLRAWKDWTPDELEEVLTAADDHGIAVAMVLSHKEHSFIEGYPLQIAQSESELVGILDTAQAHPSVQAFDIRAEPYTQPLYYTPEEEQLWLRAIAADIKAENHHYGVFANLTQNHLDAIEAMLEYSDRIVVNYYFPRGQDLGGEYNGEYVPPCVYRARLGEALNEYLDDVKDHNPDEVPVFIGQFGAYMGERDGLPYTDEEGQAAYFSAFFAQVAERPEVTGGAFFVLADADGGFAVVNKDGTKKQACDVITEAYTTEADTD